jgi:hypothetical protein
MPSPRTNNRHGAREKVRREYLARIAKTTATNAQVLASSATATGDR